MKHLFKHLGLAVGLIVAAAALLLLSDLERRSPALAPGAVSSAADRVQPARSVTVAVCSPLPAPVFEQALAGLRAGLAAAGFSEGDNLRLIHRHANGDLALLGQVIQSLLTEQPDLLIPLSTPCLASALGQKSEVPLVFGIVTSPLQAGAGRSFTDHLPRVTGAVFSLPSRDTFVWARQLFPAARRIGALYNPSEANSQDEIDRLGPMLAQLGFNLQTATINSSSDIPQALQALQQQGIELYYALGDSTCVSGYSNIVRFCRDHAIPILAADGSLMGSGALLSSGPSPFAEGLHTAQLAARVLQGENPATLPFAPSTSHSLQLDFGVAAELRLQLPQALRAQLDVGYQLQRHLGRPARLALINLVENKALDAAMSGLRAGLEQHGLKPGQDFELQYYSAQGDLALLPQLYDSALQQAPDLVISLTTPALVAGVKRVREVPYVFSVASDPVKLGLFGQGRPAHITGVHDDPDIAGLVQMARQHQPALKAIGTVYDAAQPQSLLAVEKLRAACTAQHLALYEATVSTVSDLSLATRALLQRGAQALILSTDNLAVTGFGAIHQVTSAAGVPIFVSDMDLIALGATGGIGDSYSDWGRQSATQVFRILCGVPPADLPIEATRNASRVQPATAAPAASGRPRELRLVLYNETQFSEDCARGLRDGLQQAGLVEGTDYRLRQLNAQGDMSTLSSIMTSVKGEQADLLLVVSTPCLQAALRQAGSDIPIVFTGVGDAVLAGAGRSETDHLPQVTGITTRSPFEGMARLIRQTLPQAKAVGTLFTPAEINSELYREWFAAALESQGIRLVAVPVTASADTAQASAALCQEEIQAVAQIVDNTTRPGFAQIARRAAQANLPVYVFDSSQMSEGAVLCLARDYYQAGREAADKAVAVLRGTDPASIPFNNTRSETLLLNPQRARQFGLNVSPDLLHQAQLQD